MTPKDGGVSDGPQEGSAGDALVPDEDAGAFAIVDVADTPCTPRSRADRILYPGSELSGITSLAAIGQRRVASRFDGFVLLDADGANASPSPHGGGTALAVLGDDTIAAVGDMGAAPFLSFHSSNGAATAPSALADNAPSLGVFTGGGNGKGLMVWGSQAGVRARGFDAKTFIGPPFFVAAVAEVQAFRASIAPRGDGSFGIAFSGETIGTGETNRLSFVRATTTGTIPVGFNLDIGPARRHVVQLVARPAGGWVVLVSYGTGLVSHLVFLTEEGRLDGPAKRLVGSGPGLGLALLGGELGVLAIHAAPDGPSADAGASDAGDDAGAVSGLHAAFRPFGLDGGPAAGWICLGDVDANASSVGAILAEDNGYAAAFSRASGDVVYARFDHRGN